MIWNLLSWYEHDEIRYLWSPPLGKTLQFGPRKKGSNHHNSVVGTFFHSPQLVSCIPKLL